MRFDRSAYPLLIALAILAPGAVSLGASFASRASTRSFHQEAPDSRTAEPVFAVEASLVNVNALVTDEDGRVISGLRQENFRVLDQGIPQQITHFSPTTAPITVVVLMEYSAFASSYYASKSRDWSIGFLDQLEPRDWVALVTYDLNATVRVDFTHNRANVRDSLASLGFPTFREANLFDAVLDTLDKLKDVPGRKSILLVSTGANTFGVATLDEVLKRLKGTDVTIFSVGLAEGEYTRSLSSSIGYMQARSALRTFSDQTGGIAFFPRFPSELPEIFRSITGFLRNEYTMSFTPGRRLRDGKYHKLTVEVIQSNGAPLTVKDEKGRQQKVSVIGRPGYLAPASPTEGSVGAR